MNCDYYIYNIYVYFDKIYIYIMKDNYIYYSDIIYLTDEEICDYENFIILIIENYISKKIPFIPLNKIQIVNIKYLINVYRNNIDHSYFFVPYSLL